MKSEMVADKIELTELVNKLFIYCDARLWPQLLDEVFSATIWLDMSSAGGDNPGNMEAQAVCKIWAEGFSDLDAVHHQAGHYLISVTGDTADIFAYAVATHYKKNTTKGHTLSFVGSYDLKAERTPKGWRLNQFKYNLKYIDGNIILE